MDISTKEFTDQQASLFESLLGEARGSTTSHGYGRVF